MKKVVCILSCFASQLNVVLVICLSLVSMAVANWSLEGSLTGFSCSLLSGAAFFWALLHAMPASPQPGLDVPACLMWICLAQGSGQAVSPFLQSLSLISRASAFSHSQMRIPLGNAEVRSAEMKSKVGVSFCPLSVVIYIRVVTRCNFLLHYVPCWIMTPFLHSLLLSTKYAYLYAAATLLPTHTHIHKWLTPEETLIFSILCAESSLLPLSRLVNRLLPKLVK